MENLLMRILLLVLFYYRLVSCTKLTITPPPTLDILRRSRKALSDIRNGGTLKIIGSGFNGTSQTCHRIRKWDYVGDRTRNCTSLRPFPITSCQGVCFPQRELIGNTLTYEKLLEHSKLNYKCVPDRIVHKKVKIFCTDDGSLTRYKIPVVKTCKCVQLNNDRNSVLGISKDANDPINKQTKLFNQQMLKLKKMLKLK